MLIISPLKKEGIPAVFEIEKFSFGADRKEWGLEREQDKYLVAEENGRIVGYIESEKVSGMIHIFSLAVHPNYKRKEIGKKLLEKVLNDKEAFFLIVRVSNLPAQKLYEKYGFIRIGMKRGYYAGNGEDAYVMMRLPSEWWSALNLSRFDCSPPLC